MRYAHYCKWFIVEYLHRISCFGVTLSQMDIRQESTRHTDAIAEITRYIGLGDTLNGQKTINKLS